MKQNKYLVNSKQKNPVSINWSEINQPMFQNLGLPEIVVLFGVGLLVFGPKKLPELGKSIGEAIVNFKKSLTGPSNDSNPDKSDNVPPNKHI